MTTIDYMALEAKKDRQILDKLIRQHELFILKCTSKATHRYITKNDDEWSIALLAFTQALKSYELKKGSFLNFSELVIRRRLIDYYRQQTKYQSEISVNPIAFDSDSDDTEDNLVIHLAVAEKVSQNKDNNLKYEIESIDEVFSGYGFTFMDLSDSSPRAKKTKVACAKATAYLFHNSSLISELRVTKQLPLKIIEQNTKIPRKILERHRKYIIAAIEILSGEYPYLSDYMQYIKKEIGK